MFKKMLPGLYVAAMTLIWVGPFFALNLYQYPLDEYANSYRLYYLVFSSTLLISIATIAANHFIKVWEMPGYWRKFLFVWGAYAANIVLILVVYFGCAAPGTWEYFGGCPAGSFGMLFIPSVITYLIGGAFVGLIYSMDQQAKARLKV